MPDELEPWPDDLGGRHHNQPPLEDRVLLDFDEAIHNQQLERRIIEITDAAERAPAIRSNLACGQAGDLISMARAVEEQLEGQREIHNRPLLTAQRTLKAKADGLLAPMHAKIAELRASIDAYVASQPEASVIRGDYGTRVSAQVRWLFEIDDFAKLPPAIRRHPDVIEAIEKVIRGQIKGGAREIKGVRIWSETKASIR